MSELKIKVLGPGCKNCEKLYDNTRSAISEMGIDAEVDYVKDMEEIKKYVMMTPGLLINEKVAHQGKPLPSPDKIKNLVKKATSK